MVAVLFPGQGAQNVGMGDWLVANHSVARARFDEASDILGYDLADLCRQGPKEKLDQTEFSQPALFVVAVAAAEVLVQIDPERLANVTAAAGLSLGEYTAVYFAGGLSFADGVRLVQRRGQAMQAAADTVQSGMASVIGMELPAIEALCQECRGDGEVLQPANLLCPGNVAVSGHQNAIEQLVKRGPEAGAAKVIPLAVAGAFHTELMRPAVEKLEAALAEIPIHDCRIPVYSNVDASPHTSAGEIRELLAKQVVAPVLWGQSLSAMIEAGVDRFEELGTGKVLRGTLKRVNRKFPADGFGDGP